MDLKNIYAAMGADYEDVMKRLKKEERVKKFLLKFRDKNPMELLCAALEAGAYEDAFREAHNMKGVCANLGLSRLGAAASELTEALRGGAPTNDISQLWRAVTTSYDEVMKTLAEL